jgi:phospholipid/cholesterol/gamma-HCH transport system substrate-binding protein
MTDYNTLQKRRNMIVGGFVIIAFVAFIYLIYKFQELPVIVGRIRSFELLVNFPNAPGAQENTPVKYCGRQIGRVTNVSPPFLYEDKQGRRYHHVRVTISIEKKYVDSIPSNVDIKLMKRGLGSSFIDFRLDPDKDLEPLDPADSKTIYLMDGMVLDGSASSMSEFLPPEFQEEIKTLVGSINTLANNVNKIIGDRENQANFKQTLANITTLTERATAMAEQGREMLKSVKELSDTGAEAVQNTTEQLDGTLTELREILSKVNSGDGTAAKLLNDGRLYENLLDTVEELKMSSEQLKIFTTDINDKGRIPIKPVW